jgi:SAM-dependent methyltransferase
MMGVLSQFLGTPAPTGPSSVRAALYRFYVHAERAIVPSLRSSQERYSETLRSYLSPATRWLDIGWGPQFLAARMTGERADAIGRRGYVADIDLNSAGLRAHPGLTPRVSGDVSRVPFVPAAWDVISANMVMEHVSNPAAVLQEVHESLRPGGIFVFHTPNAYHWGTIVARCLGDRSEHWLIRLLAGREEADIFPTHYRINTAAGIRRLADANRFDIVQIAHVSNSATLSMLGLLVLPELAFIRLIQLPLFAELRSGLVVTLRKR